MRKLNVSGRRPVKVEALMTGAEFDVAVRKIMLAVTRENIFSSVAAFVELGFGGPESFNMCCRILDKREREREK